ncbi:MAG: hypothetical protein ABJN22_10835 [Litorimonas sp.]
MPTKLISKALLGALSATVMAAPAFAGGNCASGNCGSSVQVMPSYAPQFGPMTIRTENPMGHLRSVNFQRSPNVSITRIHGMAPTAGLSDAPSGFTGGCHPTSTTYCRQSAGVPVQVEFNAPAPVVQAPAEPRTVRIGGGYDPSKFAPRTYGDASLVPGIAYLPTSKVVRDPAAAQQVLDTGRTRPQDVVVPGTGTAPHMGMVRTQSAPYGGLNLPGTFSPQASFSVNLPGTFQPRQRRSLNLPGTFSAGQVAPVPPMSNRTYMAAPQMRAPGLTNTQGLSLAPTRVGPSFGQPSTPVLQQSGPMAGAYGSSVAGDGTYWEKVSGPTAFGSTVATQVICKRKLSTQTVNPVIGVPVPVPVPVQQGCQTAPVQHGHSAPGRWIH